MRLERFRPGQLGGFQTIISSIRAGKKEIGIILPTGYGKSDLIRAVALQLYRDGIVCASLIVNPNDYLRGQMVDESRFNEFLSRYKIRQEFGKPLAYSAVESIPKQINLRPNGEFFLSTTIQLIAASHAIQFFPQWIEHEIHRSGLPVLVIVDETHTYTRANRWGEYIRELQRSGAIIVVLTATAVRDDGEEIIGFRYQEVRNEPYQYTVSRPGEKPDERIVDLFEGKKTWYQLEADYAYSFGDAWNEEISPICFINKIDIDIDLKSEFPGSDDIPRCMLSEIAPSVGRKLLGTLVRRPQVIRQGCESLVSYLKKVRVSSPESRDCAGIIFTTSDRDDDDEVNAHAMEIKRILNSIAPALKAVIATSANTGKGETGKDVLDRFVDGHYDILIVKAMAGLGLDCARIKVGLDLSPVRTISAVIQRLNRINRIYAGHNIAHWVTLKDQLMDGIWRKFIEEEGGAASADVDLIESWVVKVEDKPSPTLIVFGTQVDSVSDTFGKTIGIPGIIRALYVLDRIPELIGKRSLPNLAELADDLGVPSDASAALEGGAMNTGNIADDLVSSIHAIEEPFLKVMFRRRCRRRYERGRPGDSELWGAISKEYWGKAYAEAGSAYEPLSKIRDLVKLQNLLNAWTRIVEREVGDSVI